MVLLLDLDDEVPDPHADPKEPAGFASFRSRQREDSVTTKLPTNRSDDALSERPNPNLNGLSAAVACYP